LETWQLSRTAWRTYPSSQSAAANNNNNNNSNNANETKNDQDDEDELVSPANINVNGKGGKDTTSYDRSSSGSGGNASSALQGLSVQQQEEVLRGLTRVTRTYQLPRKVSLPDMVALLNDIWDCEKDY